MFINISILKLLSPYIFITYDRNFFIYRIHRKLLNSLSQYGYYKQLIAYL